MPQQKDNNRQPPDAAGSDGRTEPPRTSMRSRAAFGVRWSSIGGLLEMIFSFASVYVLARKLEPTDFGIFGYAILLRQLVGQFTQLGLAEVVVQRDKPSQKYLSTCFWANLVIATAAAAMTSALAPAGAWFFRNPKLVPVIRVVSLIFIAGGIGRVHMALLRRRLAFKTIATISIIASATQVAMAITLAVWLPAGQKYWALVAAFLWREGAASLMAIATTRWRPALQFELASFRQQFGFGKFLLANNIVAYASQQASGWVVGRMLSTAMMGIFDIARKIIQQIGPRINQVRQQVLYPLMCRVQNQRQSLQSGFLQAVRFLSLLTAPVMLGLAAVAPEFVRVVYSEKYAASIIPMQIICVAAAMRMVGLVANTLQLALARPSLGFYWRSCVLPVRLGLLIALALLGRAAARHYGLDIEVGMLIGITMATLLGAIMDLGLVHLSARLIGLSLRQYLRGWLPAAGAGTAMVAAVYVVRRILIAVSAADAFTLAASVATGAAVYVGTLRLAWPEAFKQMWDFIAEVTGLTKRRPATHVATAAINPGVEPMDEEA